MFYKAQVWSLKMKHSIVLMLNCGPRAVSLNQLLKVLFIHVVLTCVNILILEVILQYPELFYNLSFVRPL